MSRNFGDFRYKESKTETEGATFKDTAVSSEPDIIVHDVDNEEDEFIVIATDGIWECADNQAIIDFIRVRIAEWAPTPDLFRLVLESLFDRLCPAELDYGDRGGDNMSGYIMSPIANVERVKELCSRPTPDRRPDPERLFSRL